MSVITAKREQLNYLGIDPGLNGGIAVIRQRDGGSSVRYTAMPSSQHDILDFLASYNPGNSIAVIEWIHPSIQNIGKASMSKLYGSYMALQMALSAKGIPFEIVMARKWQQTLNVPGKRVSSTQWKQVLRNHAQKLFPHLELWKKPKKRQLQVCDSILIAEYCRRTLRR